nr:hypothetical protein [Pectobacterium brasiliense]
MRDNGYQTGFFGKWHFGGADKTATKASPASIAG